jgi:hypothetical protein
MKVFAAIFSFYFLLLCAQPAMASMGFTVKKECCKSCCGHCKMPVKEKSGNDKSCPGASNPLMTCCSNISFIFIDNKISFEPFFTPTAHHSFYLLMAIPEVAISIWQPPKLG